ncbi:MAG: hypothetical protein KA105_02020 [Caulobacter sp.]|jgi:uncharacterized membrane protein YczE|nr:hypothetical protein [Caulobacter sp.]
MHMTRRLVQLFAGLGLYGFAITLLVRADLGLDPWNVLNQGVVARTGWSFGAVVIGLGVLILLLWIPLRQKPGFGTLANIALVGLAVDWTMPFVATPDSLWARVLLLAAGTITIAIATGCYLGAAMGPGPRDGLMTGIVARTGWSVRVVRTSIELAVLALGWLLGGKVGVGTVVYALAIGPLVHLAVPLFAIREPRALAA